MIAGAPEPATGMAGASGLRRSAARLAAVQALYEMDMVGADADAVLQQFVAQRWKLNGDATPVADAETVTEPDAAWLDDLVHGVAQRQDELDALLGAQLTKGMSTARLECLLRVILRAGAYELSAKTTVPAAVVISEYVEVAHAFFEKPEVALINGVLDRLARALRDTEF